jgi:hypothetical protein
MKYYETHYDEYVNSVKTYNLHPELEIQYPKKLSDMCNMIFHGPSGAGKYSHVLKLLSNYSSLKYDKKITIQSEKLNYTYHISDIHYEVDMSLLGVNSKILWHEIFLQIVDIIYVKPEKNGVIVCKNFHMIHSELLDIFYSYIQQYSHPSSTIQIHFILLTEQLSFIPNNIIQSCKVLNICLPTKQQKENIVIKKTTNMNNLKYCSKDLEVIKKNIKLAPMDKIENMKELFSYTTTYDTNNHIKKLDEKDIPTNIFTIICDNIINEIMKKDKLCLSVFRDVIYDILIYNLDVGECLWYTIFYFIKSKVLTEKSVNIILKKTYIFLKYYNNNYRPIYHLESIFFTIINQIQIEHNDTSDGL